jgi:AcrR family transcriptional regulator
MTPTRLTAEERRDEVITAASLEFAATGYAGTSTDSIARRAGVSQPYLFQLFGTKKELFLASVRGCFEKTSRAFDTSGKASAAGGNDPTGVLEDMGHGYIRLLMSDPNVLRLQMHAYTACQDDEIRAVVRDNYKALWRHVAELSGAGPTDIQKFFAQGMLINVVASIGEGATFEDYLRSLLGGASEIC